MNSSERKQQSIALILEGAFKIFVEKTIEGTTFDDVAAISGVGVATIYRHYKNKQMLVIAVASYAWGKYFADFEERRPLEEIRDIPAIDRLAFGLDIYLDLYQNHKDLLKYNDNFNHFIQHYDYKDYEGMKDYFAVTDPISERFHILYEKAKIDKTVRTDIDESNLFRLTVHTMMAACHYYAGGFAWGADADKDHDYMDELLELKEMLLNYARG